MKKSILLLAAATLLFASCGNDAQKKAEQEKATQDSIAKAEEAARMQAQQDSLNKANEMAAARQKFVTDSIAKEDSMKNAKAPKGKTKGTTKKADPNNSIDKGGSHMANTGATPPGNTGGLRAHSDDKAADPNNKPSGGGGLRAHRDK
ncbi:MAG: hypothetical protein EBX41_08720 [Chitinophagia bacterium]|nr:hypothetical protein [Chitinophagia bacterium]